MNKLVSCIIIEDDPNTANMVEGILHENFPQLQILDKIPTIKRAKSQLEKLKPDFILLDVNLEDGIAFTMLKEFDEIKFKIIFTTSFDQYAIEAFKFSALDFLLKPFAPNELVKAVQRVLLQLNHESYKDQIDSFIHNINNTINGNKKLVLKNLDVVHIVSVSDIIFIQSDNNYATFFLSDGQKVVVSKTLKSYQEELKSQRFFRIHQSYLINLDHVKSFDRRTDTIMLNQSISLPVSQSKKKILFDYLNALS